MAEIDDILQYVKRKKWDFKLSNDEINIKICPYCGDDKFHFSINSKTGFFHCFKCQGPNGITGGNFWQLRRHLGDLPDIKPISEIINREASKIFKKPDMKLVAEYCDKFWKDEKAKFFMFCVRGISEGACKKFKIGFDGHRISYPYFKNGELINIKYRNISQKEFAREEGCRSTLYNIDNVKGSFTDVLVVEGEQDVLAAETYGIRYAISTSTGVNGWDDGWFEDLNEFQTIYLCLDNEPKGEEACKEWARRLGEYRCKRVYLPQKDMNACLLADYPKELIDNAINTAKEYKREEISHITYALEQFEEYWSNPNNYKGRQTKWTKFNELLGGLRLGELTTITGDTGSGKTTFSVNLIYNLLEQEQSVFLASTEMPIKKIIGKLFSIHLGKNCYEKTQFGRDELYNCIKHFKDKMMFFLNIYGGVNEDKIADCMRYCYKAFGVKYFFLDHLHYFITSSRVDDERQAIDNFMRRMAGLSHELESHIFLICHPAKLTSENAVVGMNDLKGASAIKQESHNVISIWRERLKEGEENIVHIRIPKVRDDCGREGIIKMKFDTENQRYEEIKT